MKEDLNNKIAVSDIFCILRNSIKNMIFSSLNRLQKEKYIEYKQCYMIVINNKSKCATYEQQKIIKRIEKKILKNMDITVNILNYNNRIRKDYYIKVDKEVKEIFPKIQMLYKGIIIKLIKDNIKINNNEDINILKDKLNDTFQNRTIKKIKNNILP